MREARGAGVDGTRRMLIDRGLDVEEVAEGCMGAAEEVAQLSRRCDVTTEDAAYTGLLSLLLIGYEVGASKMPTDAQLQTAVACVAHAWDRDVKIGYEMREDMRDEYQVSCDAWNAVARELADYTQRQGEDADLFERVMFEEAGA